MLVKNGICIDDTIQNFFGSITEKPWKNHGITSFPSKEIWVYTVNRFLNVGLVDETNLVFVCDLWETSGVVQEKGAKWTRIWLSYHWLCKDLKTRNFRPKKKDANFFRRLWCSDNKWDLENWKRRIAFEHMILKSTF